MKRLLKREKEILRDISQPYVETRYNWHARLRNALIALANSDPQWMLWVEKEINPRWSIERITRLIESYTRARFLRPHNYFHRQQISGLIFRDDWCFTERGTLGPG